MFLRVCLVLLFVVGNWFFSNLSIKLLSYLHTIHHLRHHSSMWFQTLHLATPSRCIDWSQSNIFQTDCCLTVLRPIRTSRCPCIVRLQSCPHQVPGLLAWPRCCNDRHRCCLWNLCKVCLDLPHLKQTKQKTVKLLTQNITQVPKTTTYPGLLLAPQPPYKQDTCSTHEHLYSNVLSTQTNTATHISKNIETYSRVHNKCTNFYNTKQTHTQKKHT